MLNNLLFVDSAKSWLKIACLQYFSSKEKWTSEQNLGYFVFGSGIAHNKQNSDVGNIAVIKSLTQHFCSHK
jgi:hypothetical protein